MYSYIHKIANKNTFQHSLNRVYIVYFYILGKVAKVDGSLKRGSRNATELCA